MISDYATQVRWTEVKKKKTELGIRKCEIQKKLASLGLTDNQVKKRDPLVDDSIWALRKGYISELDKIEKATRPLRDELMNLDNSRQHNRNRILRALFKEIFTTEQLSEIGEEVDSRSLNNEPRKIAFSFKDNIKIEAEMFRYKKLAEHQLSTMKEFRILLTKVIENGCNKFDQTEFMKVISPLNRLIIPLDELAKIKRKHFA